jgi:hypothetical protein
MLSYSKVNMFANNLHLMLENGFSPKSVPESLGVKARGSPGKACGSPALHS